GGGGGGGRGGGEPGRGEGEGARGKPAGGAGGERRGDRERRGEALRQALEDGRSVHGRCRGNSRARVNPSSPTRGTHARAFLPFLRSSPRKRGPSSWPWIPAFAGMSGILCATGVSHLK